MSTQSPGAIPSGSTRLTSTRRRTPTTSTSALWAGSSASERIFPGIARHMLLSSLPLPMTGDIVNELQFVLHLESASGHRDELNAVVRLSDRELPIGAHTVLAHGQIAGNLQVTRHAMQGQLTADFHAIDTRGDLARLDPETFERDFRIV